MILNSNSWIRMKTHQWRRILHGRWRGWRRYKLLHWQRMTASTLLAWGKLRKYADYSCWMGWKAPFCVDKSYLLRSGTHCTSMYDQSVPSWQCCQEKWCYHHEITRPVSFVSYNNDLQYLSMEFNANLARRKATIGDESQEAHFAKW